METHPERSAVLEPVKPKLFFTIEEKDQGYNLRVYDLGSPMPKAEYCYSDPYSLIGVLNTYLSKRLK
jgi:hypothetical protein